MPKFSVKDLLISLSIVCAGIGCGAYVFHFNDTRRISDSSITFLIWLYFSGGMLAGYGVGRLFKKGSVGIVLGFLAAFALAAAWRFHPNSVLWWLHLNHSL